MELEFKDKESKLYYKGVVKDIDPKKKTICLGYENNWKRDVWVPVSDVRQSPGEFTKQDAKKFRPKPGDMVEVFTTATEDEQEPGGWWVATVRNSKGDFFVVGDENFGDEIHEKERLRPHTPGTGLDLSNLKRAVIELPGSLADAPLEKFDGIRTSSKCLSLTKKKKSLVVLGDEVSIQRAKMLSKMHFKHIKSIAEKAKRIEEQQKRIEEMEQKLQNGHREEFTISKEMVGLTIGKAGANIKKAQAITGVLQIKVSRAGAETSVVSIHAKDKASAEAARKMLEFQQREYEIHARDIGRVVGPKFQYIRDIEQTSGVIGIRLNKQDDDEYANLVIRGSQETLDAACMLLDQHLNFIREANDLETQERQVYRKLSSMQGGGGFRDDHDRRGGGGGRGRDGSGGRGGGGGRNFRSDEEEYNEEREVRRSKKKPAAKQQQAADVNEPTPAEAAALSSSKKRRNRNKNKKPAAAAADE